MHAYPRFGKVWIIPRGCLDLEVDHLAPDLAPRRDRSPGRNASVVKSTMQLEDS